MQNDFDGTSAEPGDPNDIPGVLAPPPLIYLIPLVATLGIGFWKPFPLLPGNLPHLFGPGLLIAALLLLLPSNNAFKQKRTNARPWKPSTALVIEGPYRFSRNPMYLGFTLMYLGIALWVNTAWPLPALLVVMQVMRHYVIEREERYLKRKFGEPYQQYMASVRRWF